MSLKEDFVVWKTHPITKQVFNVLRKREADLTEFLIDSAGENSVTDAYRRGYIHAVRDVILTNLEDEENSND